jgi:hypothetical protein
MSVFMPTTLPSMSQSGPPLLPGLIEVELKGRADGEGELSDAHGVAVGQLNDREVCRLDLDHRDVGLLVGADYFAHKLAAVLELYLYLFGPFDDVEISVNEAVLPNDKTGAFALHRLGRAAAMVRIAIIRGLEKEIVQRGVVPVVFLCHLDDDDTRRHGLEDLGKGAVQLVHDIFSRRGGFGRNGRLGCGRRGSGHRLGAQTNRRGKGGEKEAAKKTTHRWRFRQSARGAVQNSSGKPVSGQTSCRWEWEKGEP